VNNAAARLRQLWVMFGALGALNIAFLLGQRWPVLTVPVIFIILAIMPGALLLISLRVTARLSWSYMIACVSLSLILLMLVGLGLNTFLPLLGVGQPLAAQPVQLGVNLLLLVESLAAAYWGVVLRIPFAWRWRSAGHYLLPLLYPITAVLGAISLNNGGTNAFTVVLLAAITIHFIVMLVRGQKLTDGRVIFSVYCMALAMLLMTSMRGWLITGHDVEREFFVFQLAKSNWHWAIAAYRDPYNACLSITVLPTMLSGILHMSDVLIYKLLYQVLFALVPVAVYILTNRISGRRMALMSTVLFIGFPTFFSDMSMLNRQEIAFLCLAAMLLVMHEVRMRANLQRGLFVLLGLGVTISHYSTNYSMLGIFAVVYGYRIVMHNWGMGERLKAALARFRIQFHTPTTRHHVMVWPVLVALVTLSFIWNSQLTHTSKGLADVIRQTITSISGNLKDDNKSSDTSVSIFGAHRIDPAAQLASYVKRSTAAVRAGQNPSEYFSDQAYDSYPIHKAADEVIPLTWAGSLLSSAGVSAFGINYALRQGSARLIQVLIAIGVVVLLSRERHSRHMSTELVGFVLASLGFIAMLTVLPTLSADYGLLRGFQQILMVVAYPAVLGAMGLFAWLGRRGQLVAAGALVMLFFVSSTGLLGQLTGGYYPQLHLSNGGVYFDSYYIHDSEAASLRWLATHHENQSVLQSEVTRDKAAAGGVQDLGTGLIPNILPTAIGRSSYVYLGYANVHKSTSSAVYNGDVIIYDYPTNFLNDSKDLLYSTTDSRIYR
jgi:uncharacterized membrane protein